MRAILTILLLTSVTASAAILLWGSDIPDTTRSLQLCERMRYLEFDPETDRWAPLSKPVKSTIVCPIPGTTGELNIEGLQEPFKDTPLHGKMIEVDCYNHARMKSGALPTLMPDGVYCNVPVRVNG